MKTLLLALTSVLTINISAPALASGDTKSHIQPMATHHTSFSQCPQFFPGGKPPAAPAKLKLRELLFSEFAVLASSANTV